MYIPEDFDAVIEWLAVGGLIPVNWLPIYLPLRMQRGIRTRAAK